MQRQSMGSPSSKLVRDEPLTCETQRQYPFQPSSISSASPYEDVGDEEAKKLMMIRAANFNNKPQTYIHLIPMLMLICFLILYLASHDPSQNDLAQFNFPGALRDSAESQMVMEVKKGDMVAIRRLKHLETEVGTANHRLLHRKIGDTEVEELRPLFSR